MFNFGSASLAKLATVEPSLRAVVMLALTKSPVDIIVLEGVRSSEQMAVNYGKGRSVAECVAKGVPAHFAQPHLAKVTWLNHPYDSPHKAQANGLSRAVDIAPYPIDWDDLKRFDQVSIAMAAAALELKTPVIWGADWDHDGKPREKGESDSPHFQLS